MHFMRLFLVFAAALSAQEWTLLDSGVTARLRGVSAVNERVAWASGANGTVLRTADGGTTWKRLPVPGAEKLDFRDVDAVDERTAYILSIGPGDASRIYKTTDAGATWTLQFTNPDPKAFYDAMTFWTGRDGLAVSDTVDGRFVLLSTRDGGTHWNRVEVAAPARAGEGAFAASGTNIAVRGKRIWIGLNSGRVLRSVDGGRTWAVAESGLATSESAGIFGLGFRDGRRGIAAGGDYKRVDHTEKNAAITADGGLTWQPLAGLNGLRSAVAPLAGKRWIAVGPSGADVSEDDGRTWRAVPGPGFHTFSGRFAAGEKGLIGRLEWK